MTNHIKGRNAYYIKYVIIYILLAISTVLFDLIIISIDIFLMGFFLLSVSLLVVIQSESDYRSKVGQNWSANPVYSVSVAGTLIIVSIVSISIAASY